MNIAPLYQICSDFIIRHIVQSKPISFDDLSVLLKPLECNLHITYTHEILKVIVSRYPDFVNDDVLKLLCHGNISNLNLKGCGNITLDGLRDSLTRLDQLKVLNLSDCNQLVCIELVDILKISSPKLNTLKLDGNSSLTSDILKEILKLPIENVSCENCDRLSKFTLDVSVSTTYHPANLVSINVSGCHNISGSFIRFLTDVHGPTLKNVNISWTNLDCMSLLYFAGFSTGKIVDIAAESFTQSNSESTLIKLFKERDLLELCLKKIRKPIEKSASTYLKNICAYCSQEARIRDSLDSTFSCFVESYGDYDVIDSQVVNIIEDFNASAIDLEWDVLSMDDVVENNRSNSCTCSSISSDHPVWLTANSPTHSKSDDSDSLTESYSDTTSKCKQQLYTPVITNLDISRIEFFDYNIGKKYLELFLKANPSLEQLHMSWCELDDTILDIISKSQPNLQSISLVDCERVTDVGLHSVAAYCSKLKAIDFKGMPFVWDISLMNVIQMNQRLQYMSLAESSLTDAVLIKIAEHLGDTLRHLDLSWCDNITDRGVAQVLRRCENLIYLDLRQCNVNAETVKEITKYGQNLYMVGLCGIKGLTDTLCIRMLKTLKKLRILDLSWNSSLTDDCITALFCLCPKIEELTIAGLKRISSRPFLPIISGLVKWRQVRSVIRHRLHSKCYTTTGRLKDVTDQEVRDSSFYIPFRSIHYAPVLNKLTLGYCDKVNDVHLAEIVAVCRGTLVIEDYYGELIAPTWKEDSI